MCVCVCVAGVVGGGWWCDVWLKIGICQMCFDVG